MRKNAPRKWLHAILDLLPVIMIPVFMVYSHRHDIDTYSVNVAETKSVDFNQRFNNVIYSSGSVNATCSNYKVTVPNATTTGYVLLRFGDTISNHKYYLRFDTDASFSSMSVYSEWTELTGTWTSQINSFVFQKGNSYTYCGLLMNISSFNTSNYLTFNVYDLTQMFGLGQEPTISEFNSWYLDFPYEYTLSKKELVNVGTKTYNDTDIMSQFTYNMYNVVTKYFNMNNVFGMTKLYDWFNLNIFSGNAPLYVYIVWNVILYEFIMDLLFLLYALFMFFIDVCQDLIERCFKSSKGD